MQPEAPFAPDYEPPRGLPPVQPPSGKFIARLFLVPFLIVTTVVGFLLVVNWLVGSARSPEDYLQRLDNPNPDVRWRAAEDLAQRLPRDEHLASDPKLALDLADRLRQAWQSSRSEEQALAERAARQSQAELARGRKALEPGQDHVAYLIACLGNVMVPAGMPLLNELAVSSQGSDPPAVAGRRWRAVWALAKLGENRKRFAQLPPPRQEEVLAQLQQEADSEAVPRAAYAHQALAYLTGPQARSLAVLGLDKVFTQCAADDNPLLREITAYALNFWEGRAAENVRMDALLAKLARDDGHGEEGIVRDRDEEDPTGEPMVRVPGLKIRYNATVALARRGSARVRLGVLKEMLDEAQQLENFRLKRKDGQEMPDKATAGLALVTALQAVAELHRKAPARDLSELYPAVDALARNPNLVLRKEAERTLQALGREGELKITN